MSIESARDFIERVKTDEEFAKRIAGAKSREERADIAKAEGFDFMPEELSDEELDAVAGGHWGCGHTHESEGGCGTSGG